MGRRPTVSEGGIDLRVRLKGLDATYQPVGWNLLFTVLVVVQFTAIAIFGVEVRYKASSLFGGPFQRESSRIEWG